MDTQDTYPGSDIENVESRLIEIYKRKSLPSAQYYLTVLEKVIPILKNENLNIRPYSDSGLPGGLISLKHNVPTVIIPDIHARVDFLLSVLLFVSIRPRETLEKDTSLITLVLYAESYQY